MTAFIALMLAARPAFAATVDGALITNLASATYRTTAGAGQTISYGATSYIQVATPCLMLRKSGNTTIQAAGGMVTFCITFSNCSKWASAMNVVITDVVPPDLRFVNNVENWMYEPAGSVMTAAWSSNGGTNWTAGFPVATFSPLTLKWTVDALGPGASGFICYVVSIL